MKLKKLLTPVFVLIGISCILLIYNNSAGQTSREGKVWEAPAGADSLHNPLKGSAKATEAGRVLYNTTCAFCHGPGGKGKGRGARGLKPQPKDLTSQKVQRQSDGAIFWKISHGNPPMAAYKSAYSEKQRWQLVNYIRKLAAKSG